MHTFGNEAVYLDVRKTTASFALHSSSYVDAELADRMTTIRISMQTRLLKRSLQKRKCEQKTIDMACV